MKTKDETQSTLWMVASPIGNLGDLSPRAVEIIKNADFIFCEDTRQTRKILSRFEISQSPIRVDAHTSEKRLKELLEALEEEKSAVFLTDAGAPGVSDPGGELVRVARARGIEVSPIPGASAVTAFLSVSGFRGSKFSFRGFFPRKEKEQLAEVRLCKKMGGIFLWFESPKRIGTSLGNLAALIPEVQAVAAKEMTKIHENFFYGSLQKVAEEVTSELENEGEIGEWCFGLELEEDDAKEGEDLVWINTLEAFLESRIPASEAAKRVSQIFGIPKNKVYDRALTLAKKKNS